MQHATRNTLAFTLIEIMIVVGIMGIILTMSVPLVYKVFHRAPMAEALKNIQEVCSNARAQAIMQGKEVDVVFHPRDGRIEISASALPTPPANAPEPIPQTAGVTVSPAQSGRAAKLSDHVRIDMLDINKLKHDFRDDEIARVRFFPNGTSDELTLILSSDRSEQRGITLEVTTGLASVLSEADLQNLRNGTL
jgi:prepilin-type N-terminal cleavage/methylation domain-containing protein